MTKPMIEVVVTIHGGTTITFVDTAEARRGTTVLTQLERGENVEAIEQGGNMVVIPYESVVLAEVNKTDAEYTKPEDAFCVSEGGGNKVTISVTDGGGDLEYGLTADAIDRVIAIGTSAQFEKGSSIWIGAYQTLYDADSGDEILFVCGENPEELVLTDDLKIDSLRLQECQG